MRGGIRLRITAIAMAVVAIVLIVTGVALLGSQRRILTNNLDEILNAQSRNIERTYTSGDLSDPITIQLDEDAVAQVVGGDGHVLASTANFSGQPALAPADIRGRTLRTIALPSDESSYRVLSRSVAGVVIHTATPIDDVEESVAALRTGLLVAVPLVALVLGLLIWWLVGRTLRPVEVIRSEVAAITGANLDRRVSEPRTDDEIARLARTMNAMLDRVEDASRREQRFVADASHELRSPLTRMRTELEVDLAHPDTGDLVATHRSVLEEVDMLHRLVDDLLHLARSESRVHAEDHRLIDLDDLLLVEARRLRSITDALIDTTHVMAVQVVGDPDELARALRNLCDNAARHARRTIALATQDGNADVRFSVADDGPGVPEQDRRRVFERFARVDPARQAGTGGTGLGLAIALDIVERHGGTIDIEEPEGGGARFVVTLPAAPR